MMRTIWPRFSAIMMRTIWPRFSTQIHFWHNGAHHMAPIFSIDSFLPIFSIYNNSFLVFGIWALHPNGSLKNLHICIFESLFDFLLQFLKFWKNHPSSGVGQVNFGFFLFLFFSRILRYPQNQNSRSYHWIQRVILG